MSKSKIHYLVFSRPLTDLELKKFELGLRIYRAWKINGGISAVLIQGNKYEQK